MNKVRLLPYKPGSKSAKDLARGLGILRLKPNGTFRPRNSSLFTIINWGSSKIDPRFSNARYLNYPDNVALSSNKLTALSALHVNGVNIPGWCQHKQKAHSWLLEGHKVVARTVLTGHSGRGIIMLDPERYNTNEYDDLPVAPLYTKYIKKKDEYRVHVFPDNSTWVAKKRRRLDVPDEHVNWQVRNHQNGFIYATEDLEDLPRDLVHQAVLAKTALGLDFGAVDIIYNGRQDKCYVLECNSSPGLSGRTLEIYINKLKESIEHGY